jgi:hypothetical protein
MHLVGRFACVRCLGPTALSPPYILERKWGAVAPYGEEEWLRTPAGVSYAVPRGGVGFAGSRQPLGPVLGVADTGTLTVTAQNLSSAYTPGSAGAASGTRFALMAAKTVQDAYVHITSYTGTAATVNDLDLEIRADDGTTSKPVTASTLASATAVNPASATGWIKISGWSLALSAATVYWLTVGDPDGNATDHARVANRPTWTPLTLSAAWGLNMAVTTSNGWSTVTLNRNAGIMALGFNDGTAWGQPLTALAGSTSGTYQRGLLLSGLTAPLVVYGVVTGAAAGIGAVRLWQDTSGPTGTPTASGTLALKNNVGTIEHLLFASPQTLAASTPYRVVVHYTGAGSTSPAKLQIGTGSDATLRKCLLGGGSWCWTQDTASAWVEDPDAFPQLGLLIEDQGAAGGGGGGLMGSLLNHGLN